MQAHKLRECNPSRACNKTQGNEETCASYEPSIHDTRMDLLRIYFPDILRTTTSRCTGDMVLSLNTEHSSLRVSIICLKQDGSSRENFNTLSTVDHHVGTTLETLEAYGLSNRHPTLRGDGTNNEYQYSSCRTELLISLKPEGDIRHEEIIR